MIKTIDYENRSAYTEGVAGLTNTQISRILNENLVKVDFVNSTIIPGYSDVEIGDALYLDEYKNKVFLKGNTIVASSIPSDWEYVGVVYDVNGREIKIILTSNTTAKYCDVIQFNLSGFVLDGEEHTDNFKIKGTTSNDYYALIEVTYKGNSLEDVISAVNVGINSATIDSGTNAGQPYTHVRDNCYAFYENGRVIVQYDVWSSYWQYQCSNSGTDLKVSLIIWEDFPASDVYLRGNGVTTNYRGYLNFNAFRDYFSTSGRTPTSDIPVNLAGNNDPVNKNSFENSEFCNTLRTAYNTYDNYIKSEYRIMYPQNYGIFNTNSAKLISSKFADLLVTTKTGIIKYKFPALHLGASINYNSEGLEKGNWNLPDIRDGIKFMDEDIRLKLNLTLSKLGKILIINNDGSQHKWFALRYDVYGAWYYNAYGGTLGYGHVTSAYYAFSVCAFLI